MTKQAEQKQVTPAATAPRDLRVLTCIFESFFTTPLALYGDAFFRSMSFRMCFYTTKHLSNRNSIVKWQCLRGPGSKKNASFVVSLFFHETLTHFHSLRRATPFHAFHSFCAIWPNFCSWCLDGVITAPQKAIHVFLDLCIQPAIGSFGCQLFRDKLLQGWPFICGQYIGCHASLQLVHSF